MIDDPNQLRSPIGYVCPHCRVELLGTLMPFCGACGQSLYDELRMQAIGLTVYPYRYGRPLRDMGQMNSTLADLGIRKHWLEEYHATFRTAKIRIHTTDDQRNDYEIICTSTLRLEIPVGDGWSGMLRIRIDENGNMCVFDNDNDVRVTARSVWLHHVARND